MKEKLRSFACWLGDLLKTDPSLRRHLGNIGYEDVGDVHRDSIFYHEGFEPHRFSAVELSNLGPHDPEWQHVWGVLRNDLKELIIWECDEAVQSVRLLDIDGVGASKSRGPWKSVEEFGRSYGCEHIPRTTESDFAANVGHSFPHSKAPFDFWHAWWNRRMYWMNDDGSHHAASAYVQAREQGLEFSIPSRVTRLRIDVIRARRITNRFHAFVVENRTADALFHVLWPFAVPYQSARYAPAGERLTLLFFPRRSRRASFAAKTIQEFGSPRAVYDFVEFLKTSMAEP
ncbi:MAG TPA: DUF6685 family protein [Longimicrobium sp.]|nr:DUF6685 family protein [Longimicrobium sp.]